MITTQPTGQQTGEYSRIANPRAILTPEALAARLKTARTFEPTRNLLAGAAPTGLFGRIAAWFRGER